MSISVGDKYVIEIGAVAELPEGKKKYFIKPFESLVFDRKGLEQLEKFDVQALKEYKKGFEDGYNKYLKARADENYDKGYSKALEDTSDLIAYFNRNFTAECYPEEYKKDYSLYDLIAKYGLAKVLKDYKAHEEKKEADEIKIGDEVKDLATNNIGIVLSVGQMIVYITEINHIYSNTRGSLEKTGRHFGEEIEQLLSKLRD